MEMLELDYSRKPELRFKNVIYKITNVVTGKMYVGQTKQYATRRWKSHRKDARDYNKTKKSKCDYLCRAINKYGVTNFSIEVLEHCKQEELNSREVYWIKTLNTLAPNGYNLNYGGDVRIFSQQTIDKMRKSRTGKRLNVDYEQLRILNSRPMKFISPEGFIYVPKIPADFMRENKLDRSWCHKIAKGLPRKTKGRNGKVYLTIPKHHKGWRCEYI